ncbi:MAG: PrsW family intramembrane metalloprotease [Lachnospiraceae bacterium]|nr:PrsW family intramembrane metalloprotease [Lachnospiraceae bacterium]
MNYIENIYVCLAAPILVACIFLRGRSRKVMIFVLAGITTSLLSSYITSFLASLYEVDKLIITIEIAPTIEEIMKFLPILFYVVVFTPGKKDETAGMVMATAVGFATFENVCYLTINGAQDLLKLLIRGFGTGTMHVISSIIMTFGMIYIWDRLWMRLIGTIGLLSLAGTFHAVYNILVSQPGHVAVIGYLLPVCMAVCMLPARNSLRKKARDDTEETT